MTSVVCKIGFLKLRIQLQLISYQRFRIVPAKEISQSFQKTPSYDFTGFKLLEIKMINMMMMTMAYIILKQILHLYLSFQQIH